MADKLTVDVLNYPEPAPRKSDDHLNSYKGWAYSGITLIAGETASIPVKLYKKTSDDIVEVEDHPAIVALNYANDFLTGRMLRDMTFTYQLLLGEAAWFLLRNKGVIIGMMPLRPDWLELIPDGTGGIKQYLFHPNGSFAPVKIDPEDIIFFKDFDPKNLYRGYGKIRAAAIDIDIDDYSDRWNRNFFFNSAVPSMVISTEKKLDKASKKRFVDKWQQSLGGIGNANKIAFMDGGELKVEAVGSSMQELDFQESKERLQEKILGIFHLSKANIGVTTDVNRANAEAQEIRFLRHVVTPLLVNYVEFLNEFYLPKFEDSEGLFFNFDDPVPEDAEADIAKLQVASQQGWMSVNEIRSELGMDPIEGGDVIYRPSGIQVVDINTGEVVNAPVPTDETEPDNTDSENEETDEVVEEAEDEKGFLSRMFNKKVERKVMKYGVMKAPRPIRPKYRFGAPIPAPSPDRVRLEALHKEIHNGVKKIVVELMRSPQTVAVKDEKPEVVTMSVEQKEAYWKAFVKKTDIEEALMRQKIKNLSEDQENAVLAKVDSFKSSIGKNRKLSPNSFMFNIKVENKRWYKDMRPFVAGVVHQRGNEVLDELESIPKKAVGALDMASEAIDQYLKELETKFVAEVNDTTRQELIATITEGLKKGETVDQIKKRVNAVYEALNGYRADTIARTQVLQANNFAAHEAYVQSGGVVAKEWFSALDAKVRDTHVRANGQIVKLTEKFVVGSDRLNQPGDPNGSAEEIINCRCTTLPITDPQMRAYEAAVEKEKAEKDKGLESFIYAAVTERVAELNAEKARQLELQAKAEAKRVELETEDRKLKADWEIKNKLSGVRQAVEQGEVAVEQKAKEVMAETVAIEGGKVKELHREKAQLEQSTEEARQTYKQKEAELSEISKQVQDNKKAAIKAEKDAKSIVAKAKLEAEVLRKTAKLEATKVARSLVSVKQKIKETINK